MNIKVERNGCQNKLKMIEGKLIFWNAGEDVSNIYSCAKDADVAFLVVGDPFGATTHSDLVLRAREQDIPFKNVHNASIMNAIACTGLQLYNFGETVSIPFWTDSWKPDSFYQKILKNRECGYHTLCLLDIKVKEQSEENLCRGRKIYEPPRFMSTQQVVCLLDLKVNQSINFYIPQKNYIYLSTYVFI